MRFVVFVSICSRDILTRLRGLLFRTESEVGRSKMKYTLHALLLSNLSSPKTSRGDVGAYEEYLELI
jgi:hypothetical protein